MAEIKWTEEQQKAISCTLAGEILVSAAAGSGKTAVLTQRILEQGVKGNVMPEQLAVMTFTEKAAANMKEGIEEKLAKALAHTENDEDRERLRLFKEKLPLAQISTIHAFCLRLIREYQNELDEEESILGGMRQFSVLSAQEAEMLKEDALDRILAELYTRVSALEDGLAVELPEMELLSASAPEKWLEDFARLQELYAAGGKDLVLRERIMSAHSFLRSLPDYGEWCKRSLAALALEAYDFLASDTAAYYLDRLDQALHLALSARRDLVADPFYNSIEPGPKLSQEKAALLEYVPLLLAGMERLSGIDGPDRWNEAVRLGSQLQKWKAMSNRGNEEKLAFYELLNTRFGPLLSLLNSAAASPTVKERFSIQEDGAFWLEAEEIEQAAREQLPLAARFLELVLLLDRRYAELKKQRRRIDFSDLEHTALLICRKPAIGESLRRRYLEIMIDEYQDSSPLQEAIIRAIGCGRVYMVGDIKQSIYRFRHAEPRLFASKLDRFAPADKAVGDGPGHYMLLNKNFRSHPGLIHWINRFFRYFLRKETGEIDYDEEQALVPGLAKEKFPKRNLQSRFSIQYLTEGEQTAEAEIYPEQEKMIAVLDAVRQLREEGFAWGDIAILGRTHDICGQCQDVLLSAGIPAVIGSAKKYLDTPELRLLEQWVRLIGNALQDLPLAAVLRSPLHGRPFREEELLEIARLPEEEIPGEDLLADGSEESYFFRRFIQYSRSGSDTKLRERCAKFLDQLSQWRQDAKTLSMSRVLTGVLEQSGWKHLLSGLSYGEERVRDVENFIRLCEDFERHNGYDPVRLARKLSKLRDKKVEIDGWDKVPEGGDSVRIMTVHTSKGLEFPAVIYPRAERLNITRSEGNEAFVMDAEGGMAAHYASEQGLIQSLRTLRLKEQISFANRAEDYRLLYVCLTRAIERVIVLGNGKPGLLAEMAEELSHIEGEQLPDGVVLRSNSDFALLGRWAIRELPELAERAEKMKSLQEDDLNFTVAGDGLSFSVRTRASLLESLAKEQFPEEETARVEAHPADGLITADPVFFPETDIAKEQLTRLLRDELPGSELLLLPSKLTVSELQKQNYGTGENRATSAPDDFAMRQEEAGEQPYFIEGLAEMALTFRSPDLEPADRPTKGAAFGSFLHKLLQHLPLDSFFGPSLELLPQEGLETAYRNFIREEIRLSAMSPDEIGLADEARPFIFQFLESEIARRLCEAERNGFSIWREIPFTLAVPAPGISEDSGEITLVQGMIDLFFQAQDELLLLDYKSDFLRGSTAEREAVLRERYSEQMKYYKEAIRRIYGQEPTKILLWVIREGRALEI